MRLTNEKLYALCKKYGAQARFWRQKFIGLLPEVNRRCLYEQKGFSSIFEFAAKLCGLSKDQVYLALNLEKRFEDKPILKKMLVDGEVSISKLSRVVSIVTPENEEELAEKIKLLSKSALDTWVRDAKCMDKTNTGETAGSENKNPLQNAFFEGEGLPGQTLRFQLAEDVTEEFNELYSKGIDVNELLRGMLKERREKIEEEKNKIAFSFQENRHVIPVEAATDKLSASRYIPVKIRKILREEHSDKCSIPTCKKPAETIHHTQRFSLSRNHDPRFLAPLCHDHHAIAHSIDVKYHEARAVAIT